MNSLHGTPEPKLGRRFREALDYAAGLHNHQIRKGTGTPYVSHLLAVASLVLEDGGDEDQAAAALLHDAVEDQGGEKTRKEIYRRFGERVGRIVDACSDSDTQPKPPWKERKEKYLTHVASAPEEVLRVALADKLHNLWSMERDLREQGETLWSRFKSGREAQIWFYSEFLRIVAPRVHSRMTAEYGRILRKLRRTRAPSP
ncbi:MAG: HD domain-containing protein [Pseudomonadota bacterium]